MRFLIGASLVAVGAFVSGAAEGRAASELMTGFTEANLKEVISDLGATDISLQKPAGGNVRFFKYTLGGRTYLTFLDLCDGAEGGCRGIQIGASFGGATFTLETVNKFNSGMPMGRAHLTQAGTLVSTRYITATNGVTREHVVSEFKNLFTLTDALVAFVKESRTIATAPSQLAPTSFAPSPASPFDAVAPSNTIR